MRAVLKFDAIVGKVEKVLGPFVHEDVARCVREVYANQGVNLVRNENSPMRGRADLVPKLDADGAWCICVDRPRAARRWSGQPGIHRVLGMILQPETSAVYMLAR